MPNRRVVLRLMGWGRFEGSVLDSLEYGFDVEVVGAVGVDVVESGGAYVGQGPYGGPPPGGERTRGRAGGSTSTLGLGGLPDCDATAANGCPRDRDTNRQPGRCVQHHRARKSRARCSGSGMTGVGIGDSDPRRLTGRSVSIRQHRLGRCPTGGCSVGSCPGGDARRVLQSARHRLLSEPGS